MRKKLIWKNYIIVIVEELDTANNLHKTYNIDLFKSYEHYHNCVLNINSSKVTLDKLYDDFANVFLSKASLRFNNIDDMFLNAISNIISNYDI